MRVIVIVKGNAESESGVLPTEKELTDMGKYNEELVAAGVMQTGEGIHPTSKGVRVQFGNAEPAVVRGPFQSTDIVAGYWVWKVKSLDEAIQWAKKAPFGPKAELEIRPIFEAEDFGESYTDEVKAQEDRLRKQLDAQTH